MQRFSLIAEAGCSAGRRIGTLAKVRHTSHLSWVLAPETATPKGTPRPSVSSERLVPDLARSVGLGPVFPPTERGLGHRPVQALPLPLDALQFVVLVQGDAPEVSEDPLGGPLLEVVVQGTATAEFGWGGFPLTAGAEDVEDAVEHRPQVRPGSPPLGALGILGQERLDSLPQGIGNAPIVSDPFGIHRRPVMRASWCYLLPYQQFTSSCEVFG